MTKFISCLKSLEKHYSEFHSEQSKNQKNLKIDEISDVLPIDQLQKIYKSRSRKSFQNIE